MSQNKNILYEKCYAFAIRVVKLTQYLQSEHKEFVLSKQILRSGTAIGALVSESKYAQSNADFLNKLTVALKEANETQYWINLLHDTDYINKEMHKSLYNDIDEVLSLLISITKTIKNKCITP
ncbi:MAG: four helix bundle protein [Sulfurovum sp.]|jgi:four helix bundle protein|nr:four helix bundle protein [Sulfurovum sp.]